MRKKIIFNFLKIGCEIQFQTTLDILVIENGQKAIRSAQDIIEGQKCQRDFMQYDGKT